MVVLGRTDELQTEEFGEERRRIHMTDSVPSRAESLVARRQGQGRGWSRGTVPAWAVVSLRQPTTEEAGPEAREDQDRLPPALPSTTVRK